jgi:phosphocarrier protein HPr
MEMDTTITQRFKITFPEGLHLRPSAMLAKIADRFGSVITVCFNGSEADAKSPLEMIMLEATCGKEVTVIAKGHDAAHAMGAITRMFSTGFDENRS